MSEDKITIELTASEAEWLINEVADWWEMGYSGLEEVEYWLPIVNTYLALERAGVKRTRNTGGME